MIVLDANILIRAVLGKRVRLLTETYAPIGVRFYAPDVAWLDAERYLPSLLSRRGKSGADIPNALRYLRSFAASVGNETSGLFQMQPKQRLQHRDEEDWPILASALSLCCAIWTEDVDFFGTGVPVWTSDRVEILLKEQSRDDPYF